MKMSIYLRFSLMMLLVMLSLVGVKPAYGQQVTPRTNTPTLQMTSAVSPTSSANINNEASAAAREATDEARLVERVVEKKSDITEPQGEVQGRLERYLLQQQVKPLSVTNVLQHAVRRAVVLGVPANTVVLVLLFPVVAAIIAASRHLIGLRGFGIFTPAVLSVAFVATGVFTGILLFAIILFMANVGRRALKKLKLQYLPRMALILWFVCFGVLAALLVAPYLQLKVLMSISIFPILILVLLAENFIEVQIGKSKREATELAMETILLALICSLLLSLDAVQKFALLYPELLAMSVAVFDVFMGRYSGLRLNEYFKFKKIG